MVLNAVKPNYPIPPVVHGLMTIVATAAFGAQLIDRNGNK